MSRIRVRCNYVEPSKVWLHPVYSGSADNEQFFNGNPIGQIIFVNVRDSSKFEVNGEYYLDISRVGDSE